MGPILSKYWVGDWMWETVQGHNPHNWVVQWGEAWDGELQPWCPFCHQLVEGPWSNLLNSLGLIFLIWQGGRFSERFPRQHPNFKVQDSKFTRLYFLGAGNHSFSHSLRRCGPFHYFWIWIDIFLKNAKVGVLTFLQTWIIRGKSTKFGRCSDNILCFSVQL